MHLDGTEIFNEMPTALHCAFVCAAHKVLAMLLLLFQYPT